MATQTSAKRTGIQQPHGRLEVGKVAEVLIPDQELQIQPFILPGKLVES